MTYESIKDPAVSELGSLNIKQVSAEEIAESLKSVSKDIGQIGKLLSEEKLLVAQFFSLLPKFTERLALSIEVSTSALPSKMGDISQAHLDPEGHLILKFVDGHQKLLDLSKVRNRDLMMVVAGNIVPKLGSLVSQNSITETQKPKEPLNAQKSLRLQKTQVPVFPLAPLALPVITTPEIHPLITIKSSASAAGSAPLKTPEKSPETPQMLEMQVLPALPDKIRAKIANIEAETLGYLKKLGSEVFDCPPVSTHFNDWMVNLRQVMSSFGSNDVVTPDETFADECTRIFRQIEGELANKMMEEAELETAAKSLARDTQLLSEIDAGYAAETKRLVVRGKSALDFLIKMCNT